MLDAGGGPGRYSFELCKAGYEVVLLDLSPGCVEFARSQLMSEPESVQKRMKELVVGDVRDLSRFEEDCFGAVLCFDPLSYICEQAERVKAVSELTRVVRHGGVVFVSVRGYFAVLRTILEEFSDELLDPGFEMLVNTGDTMVGGAPVHFFRADEIKDLAESSGLTTVDMAGCQGLSTGLKGVTNLLGRDDAKWKRWCDLVLRTCNEPAVVDMAGHMLYVGRKPS